MACAAIKIDGRKGRFEQFANGTYDLTPQQQNGRPVWKTRNQKAAFLFHTGKARWVVSKAVDDGEKCYCYMDDTGVDPVAGSGIWVVCDSDNQWRVDKNMHISVGFPMNDAFMQLRNTVGVEMDKYGLKKSESLKQMWKILDVNGNGIVSLAEIDKLVVEMVKGGHWPAWMNNKPALINAYKESSPQGDEKDPWLRKEEFADLLMNLFWFNKLFLLFNEIAGDRRMDFGEFQKGMAKLGMNLKAQDAQEEFKRMDSGGGGQVLFVEFCAYVRNRVSPDHKRAFDASVVTEEQCGKIMRQAHGNRGTHTHYVTKKCVSDFDGLEATIKGIMQDKNQLKGLWKALDFNGNNVVSLAEIDKWVVEAYPLLNHKPALMRAYKATTAAGNGDDWVQKNEFKNLLSNLFYFNKLFWLFEVVDDDKDRRMTVQEFKKMLCLTRSMNGMSDAQATAEFKSIDRNGGGVILFDEFCTYFAAKKLPEALVPFEG